MDLQETLNRYFYNQTINELRLMNESASGLNLSYNSLLYLDIISYMPQCTVSTLACALHISKSAVTMKVAELAGVSVPDGTRLIIVKPDHAGAGCVWSKEKMFPVMSAYAMRPVTGTDRCASR